MTDYDKALAEISDIRSAMAASAIFRGFGPEVVALTGVLAGGVWGLQSFWPQTFAPTASVYFASWIITAAVCALLIGIEMIARTRRLHGDAGHAMLIQAIENFVPAAVTGALLGAALYHYAPTSLWLLPGLWQILIALGVFAAVRTLPPSVNIVGAWYLVAGLTIIVLSAETKNLMPWMMGLPFMIGQLIAAAVLKLSGGEDNG